MVKTRSVTAKTGWAILAVTFFAGFTAPANMAKVMALGPVIMEVFGLTEAGLGWTISMFYILSVIFAPVAVLFIKKVGIRGAVTIAVACGIFGNLLGIISTNIAIFTISRVLEGAGMGIMAVAGASAIAPWFPPEKRGFPLGIWAMWVALAMFICPMLYGQMVGTLGMNWTIVWWVNLIFDAVILIIFNLAYRKPEVSTEDDIENGRLAIGRVLRNSKSLVALALIFLFDSVAFMGINGFLTTYLRNVLNVQLALATFFSSYLAIIGTLMAPIGGKISDIIKSKKKVLLVALVCGVVVTATFFQVTNANLYYLLMVFGGIAMGGIPAIIWGATPDTVDPQDIPSANATVAFTQNLGMFIGAIAMGSAITGLGWMVASFVVLVPCYIICILLWFVGLREGPSSSMLKNSPVKPEISGQELK